MDWSPLWISVKTSLVATAFSFLTGLFAAWWVVGLKSKWKGFADGLLTLPMILPPTVVGFILLVLFGRNGWLGGLLRFMEVRIVFTWTATVLAATVVSFPLMYKTARGAIEQVDGNLIAAARTLGIREIRIFLMIIIPNAWSGIIAGTILAFARALGEFGATLMIAGNIPGRTQTIPMAIWFASESGNDAQAVTWVMMIMALSLLMMLMMNYWNERGKRKC